MLIQITRLTTSDADTNYTFNQNYNKITVLVSVQQKTAVHNFWR